MTWVSLLSWVSGHCANPRNQSGPSGSNNDDLPTASSAWSWSTNSRVTCSPGGALAWSAAEMRCSSATAASTASGSVQNGGTICALTITALVSSHAVMSRAAARLMSSKVADMSGRTPACMKAVPASVKTTLCDRNQRPYLPRGPSASTYSRNPGGCARQPGVAARRRLAWRRAALHQPDVVVERALAPTLGPGVRERCIDSR